MGCCNSIPQSESLKNEIIEIQRLSFSDLNKNKDSEESNLKKNKDFEESNLSSLS